jgi:hypothetical protein
MLKKAKAVGWFHGLYGWSGIRDSGVRIPKEVGQHPADAPGTEGHVGESPWMVHKILDRIREGWHVSRTYSPMVPFLKGLHLIIDNWRPDRDGEGWKLSRPQIEAKYVTDK